MDTEEDKEFTKQIYLDKAKNVTKYALIMEVISIFISIIFRKFSIDTISVIVALILTAILYLNILNKEIDVSKKYIIAISIMIVISLIFGILNFLINIEEYNEDIERESWANLEYGTEVPGHLEAHLYEYLDTLAIPIIVTIIIVYKDLCKAEGDKRFRKSTDWFYDTK